MLPMAQNLYFGQCPRALIRRGLLPPFDFLRRQIRQGIRQPFIQQRAGQTRPQIIRQAPNVYLDFPSAGAFDYPNLPSLTPAPISYMVIWDVKKLRQGLPIYPFAENGGG
jgi:hypothetical protein